jgi:hypothetical protein
MTFYWRLAYQIAHFLQTIRIEVLEASDRGHRLVARRCTSCVAADGPALEPACECRASTVYTIVSVKGHFGQGVIAHGSKWGACERGRQTAVLRG